jgi:hypothetical protein
MGGKDERSAAIKALLRQGARTPFASAPAPDIKGIVTRVMDPHGEQREIEKWRTRNAAEQHVARDPHG